MFQRKMVLIFSRKPVGGSPMSETLEQTLWETIIRMREKVLVGRRGNAFFRGKKLSMSRNFLSQPCRCGEYEQKAWWEGCSGGMIHCTVQEKSQKAPPPQALLREHAQGYSTQYPSCSTQGYSTQKHRE